MFILDQLYIIVGWQLKALSLLLHHLLAFTIHQFCLIKTTKQTESRKFWKGSFEFFTFVPWKSRFSSNNHLVSDVFLLEFLCPWACQQRNVWWLKTFKNLTYSTVMFTVIDYLSQCVCKLIFLTIVAWTGINGCLQHIEGNQSKNHYILWKEVSSSCLTFIS